MTFNTGNPIGSTDARDRSDNSENLDLAVNSLSQTFVDRLGVTRDTLEGIYQKSAYYRAGTFDAGYTLTNNRQTLAYGNVEYSWAGTFPKVVAAGSTPATTGGIGVGAWVDRSGETLKVAIMAEDGANLIGSMSYAQLRAYSGAGETVKVWGINNVFDGASGTFKINISDTTSADDGGTIIVDASSRRWYRIFTGKIKAAWFGFSELNADNAVSLQNAINTGKSMNLPVVMPGYGIPYWCSKVTVYTDTVLLGAGVNLTKLKAPNNAPTGSDIICSDGADELFGTNSDDGANRVTLSNFSCDGNRQRTGNSSGITFGTCVKLYGRTNDFSNLSIYHSADEGMRTEWGAGGALAEGLEGRFRSITIGYSGGNGWRFGGPHDSHCDDIIIHTSGQKATNTYKNLFVEKGNARWSKIHSYSLFYTDQGAPSQASRVSHALYIAGGGAADGNEFIESHFEGGMVNVYNGANGTIIDGSCRIYYPWNGNNIVNDGSNCVIHAWLGEEYKGIGLPLAKGIIFGGTYGGSTNCDVNLIGSGMAAGWVDWGGIGGNNRVVVRGYNPAGVAQVGSPPSANDIDIYVHGPALTAIKQEAFQIRNKVEKLAAAGTTQANAAIVDKSIRTVAISGGGSGAGLKMQSTATLGNGHKVQLTDITGTAKKVYPLEGGNILGLGINNPVNIPALGTVHLTVIDANAGEWVVG